MYPLIFNSLFIGKNYKPFSVFDKYRYCNIDPPKNRLLYGILKIGYKYFPITKIVDKSEREEERSSVPLQDDDSLSHSLVHEKHRDIVSSLDSTEQKEEKRNLRKRQQQQNEAQLSTGFCG